MKRSPRRTSATRTTRCILIDDTPLGYTPPLGPAVRLSLHYNHRSKWVGSTQPFGNVGPGWRLDWLSYVMDNNTTAVPPYAWTEVVLRGVGTEVSNSYSGFTHWKTHAELVQVDDDPPQYERRLPDDTIEIYTFPDRAATLPNRKIF